ATDPNANVVVLGDLNEYQFNSPVDILKGGNTPVLNNLTDTLAPSERYTYNFQGNSQALDHILVSNSINNLAEYDVVHINSEYANQATDHDPGIVRLNFATTATPVTEIQGDNTNNRIIGTANNELILGLAGNDTLKGKKWRRSHYWRI
uniref:endonuclease/exonuclease/phosphatase family protein n=1 Tax=Anaplasma marginale TaxID=770 RepID=UPI0018E9E5B3